MSESNPMHPFTKLVIDLAKKDPMHENMGFPEFSTYTLSKDSKSQIRVDFEKYYNTNELQNVVMEILRLILLFESKNSEDIVKFLAELVVSAEEEIKKMKKKSGNS
jgi:hypothetical protein